jgi:hypothetical protein
VEDTQQLNEAAAKGESASSFPKVFVALRFVPLFVSPGAVVAGRRRQGKTVTVRAACLACL